MASLLGFGSAAADVVVGTTAGVASIGKTAAMVGAKASLVPGGSKLRTKLIDAANNARFSVQEKVRVRVVKYFDQTPELLEEKIVEKKKVKLGEVEITGYPIEKVLRCETGKKKVDKELRSNFLKLSLRTSDYQPASAPIIRVTDGYGSFTPDVQKLTSENRPLLEERGSKTFLVFYPLVVERIAELVVEVSLYSRVLSDRS